MKRMDKDPILSAELARLSLADSQYINGARIIQAIANADLSVGDFPDVSKVRSSRLLFFVCILGMRLNLRKPPKLMQPRANELTQKQGTAFTGL